VGLDRTIAVYRLGRESLTRQGRAELYLSADTNEQCDTPEYIVEYLERLQACEPGAYAALLYIEQPTERDLTARRFDMRAIARRKPVIVDESLIGFAEMDLALALGWLQHCLTTRKYLVRGDGSTAHEGIFDLNTGEFLRQTTHQGYRGDSSWARGLTWALYGFGAAYDFTRDARFLQTEACAQCYISF